MIGRFLCFLGFHKFHLATDELAARWMALGKGQLQYCSRKGCNIVKY